jgi:hypothetical protein
LTLIPVPFPENEHYQATKKEFVPPYEDLNLKLGGLLALNLHEFSNDVEEICDQVRTPRGREAANVYSKKPGPSGALVSMQTVDASRRLYPH